MRTAASGGQVGGEDPEASVQVTLAQPRKAARPVSQSLLPKATCGQHLEFGLLGLISESGFGEENQFRLFRSTNVRWCFRKAKRSSVSYLREHYLMHLKGILLHINNL